jgi:uncharacterized membrane protein
MFGNAFTGWHLLVILLLVVIPAAVAVGIALLIANGSRARAAREERIAQRAAQLLRERPRGD